MIPKIKMLGDRRAEVLVYGEIGWETDSREVLDQMANIDADHVTVRINSYGGDAFDGVAIMNILRAHHAEVTCVVEGVAASAASLIAVGAGKCVMREGTQLMIHDALFSWTRGNAADLRKQADELDRLSDQMAGIYARAAGGGDVEQWRDLMRAETWFTADEAVEAGLASVVEAGVADMAAAGRMPEFKYAGRGAAPAPVMLGVEVPVNFSDKLRELARSEGVEASAVERMLQAMGEKDAAVDAVGVDAGVDIVPNTGVGISVGTGGDTDVVSTPAEGAAGVVDEVDAPDVKVANAEAKLVEARGNALTVQVEVAKLEELRRDAAYGRDARLAAEREQREQAVAKAISEGRISAKTRDRWLERLEKDPFALDELEALSPLIPRAELGHGCDVDEEKPVTPSIGVGLKW